MMPEKAPPISRVSYAIRYWTMALGLLLLGMTAFNVIAVRIGLPPYLGGALVAPIIIFARHLTDESYRLQGLSRSGRDVEERRPAATEPSAPLEAEPFEARLDRSISNLVVTIALLLIALIVLVTILDEQQRGRESLLWLYALFAGLAALGYSFRYITVARVGPEGLALPDGNPFRFGEPIPWERFVSSEIVQHHGTLGQVSSVHVVLTDDHGKSHMLNLGSASREDRSRILGYLKQRFPKLDHKPWEL